MSVSRTVGQRQWDKLGGHWGTGVVEAGESERCCQEIPGDSIPGDSIPGESRGWNAENPTLEPEVSLRVQVESEVEE